MIEGLAPAAGGVDEDPQIGLGRFLADELLQRLRAQSLVCGFQRRRLA